MSLVVGVLSHRFHSSYGGALINEYWSAAVTLSVVAAAPILAAGKAARGHGWNNTCRLFPEADVETRA